MAKLIRWCHRGEDGQSMVVELVLLFPLLLGLLTMILEAGWWVNAHQVASEAAHQAARSAAQQGIISEESVPAQIAATLRGGNLDVNAATYTVSVPNAYVTLSGSVANPPPTCQADVRRPPPRTIPRRARTEHLIDVTSFCSARRSRPQWGRVRR